MRGAFTFLLPFAHWQHHEVNGWHCCCSWLCYVLLSLILLHTLLMLLLLLVGVVVGNTYLTSLGGDGGGYRSNDCLADGWLNV